MSDLFGTSARFTAPQDDDEPLDELTDHSVSELIERWMVLSGQRRLCVEVPTQRELNSER